MTEELNEPRLKSACKNFREKQNEKFAKDQAAKDLNVLYGVVDKSVMTYHQGEFCFMLNVGLFCIEAKYLKLSRNDLLCEQNVGE